MPGCDEDSCEIGCAVFEMGREAGYFPTFRYQAKPSSSEKSAGLEHRDVVSKAEVTGRAAGSAGLSNPASGRAANSRNPHPTTKPVKLMRHLCRLVTPSGGLVLDPFTGSGTTGCAALCEDFRFLGFEQDATYAEVARERMQHWDAEAGLEIFG